MRRGERSRLAVVIAGVLVAGLVTVTSPSPAVAEQDAAPVEPHPRLLFGADDVHGLRQRVTSGVPGQAWEGLRLKAERHLATVLPELAGDETWNSNWVQGVAQMQSYLIDLGFAYLLSGDERYGRRAIDLMLALERAGWPVAGDPQLGQGMLSRGLALAFDWTYDLMTQAERTTIVASLVDELPPLESTGIDTDGFFSCLEPGWWGRHAVMNWVGVCGGGAGLLLLAIEGEPGTPDLTPWIARARDRTVQHLAGHPYPTRTNYGSGGDGAEGIMYTFYGLSYALPFGFAWQRLKGEDVLGINPGLRNVPLWVAFEQIPGEGGRFEPRNDSSELGGYAIYPLSAMFFELRPEDGVSGWLWDQTAGPEGDDIFASPYVASTTLYTGASRYVGKPLSHLLPAVAAEVFTILYHRSPEELPRTNPAEVSSLSRHYPERGLVHFRTGFTGHEGDVRATFEARRNLIDGHRQFDLGNFTISGYGARFALDSGYPNQDGGGAVDEDANRTSGGHNVVIIDNQNWTQWPQASLVDFETIPYYVDSPNLTFVRSDLRSAYAFDGRDPAEIPWADRNVLFSRTSGEPVLVAVSDNLNRSGSNHIYSWQVHTDAAHAYVPTGTGLDSFVSVAPNGAAMAGAVAEANGPRWLTTGPWPGPATTPLHTVVFSRDRNQAQRRTLDHLAVLAITPPGTVPATPTPLSVEGGTAISVSWSGGEAVVGSAAHGSPGITGAMEMAGSFGKVTVGRGESVLDRGTGLTVGGRDYITVDGGPSSVVVSGDKVVVSGPASASYRVFAPQPVTSVTVNDMLVSFAREGDYVSFSS